jgi:mannose-1-phosphate guanylyltransferase
VAGIVVPDQIFVVLTKSQQRFYADQVNAFQKDRRLIQPGNRGTAPAIVYAISRLWRLDPNGVVAFFPSDHHFADEQRLSTHLDSAFCAAEDQPDRVILLGISPDAPEPDYGWIEPGSRIGSSPISTVERFWEKPSERVARALMGRGGLWNSFIMAGRVEAFLKLVQRCLPEMLQSFDDVTSGPAVSEEMALNDLFSRIRIASFSHQVLSPSPEALGVLRADGLGWSDLGHPRRVLSIWTRKGMEKEWESQLGHLTALVRTASA